MVSSAVTNRRRLFAHSYKDSYLVALCVLEIVLLVYAAVGFSSLSTAALGSIAILGVYLNCTNYQCIAHNFIHNPFFKSDGMNACFSVINSAALGVPQSLYRVHHLNHHQYNSVVGDPNALHVDMSSIYRYARTAGVPEPLWRYALLGPLRADISFFTRRAILQGYGPRLAAEVVAMALFWTALAWCDLRYFVMFFLPVWYFGQTAAYAENYLEHYGATPGDRLADSVSCYGKFYNFIWFQNGYHQEHHYRPRVHWTKVAELRTSQMKSESQRRVVKWAHWFNF
jgi:fatty acid desaturase